MLIDLANGGQTAVDDCMFDADLTLEVWPGQFFEFRVCDYTWRHKDHERLPYVQTVTSRGGRQCCIRLHRLLTQARRFDVVDHIDRNVLNNTLANLRLADHTTNNRNRSRHIRRGGIYENPLTGERLLRTNADGRERVIVLPKVG